MMLRTVLLGLVSLAALACRPLQAQTTFDPLFFCGVVGGGPLMTTQGNGYTFPATERPSRVSVFAHPAWQDNSHYVFGGGNDPAIENFTNIGGAAFNVTEPSILSGTLEIRNETTVVGIQEWRVIIFADATQRDAFFYYLQLQDQSATYSDYLYATAHLNYTYFIGQENQGLALYFLYTGLADYYYLTTVDENPQFAAYYYWYYRGLGAYYFYEGEGDLESANLAFAYFLGLANGSL